MTAKVLFIHGYPDTHRVWDPVRAQLKGYDTVAPDLPGHGRAMPRGLTGTRWDLAAWLTAELKKFSRPPHVVAHDVGGMVLHSVLIENPELVRSWALTSTTHPDWPWHHNARVWQTTTLGEAARDEYLAYPRKYQVIGLTEAGVPAAHAPVTAEYYDRTMFDAGLAFYRSSVYLGDWWPAEDAELPPGLVMWGARDRYQTPEWGVRLAARTRSRFVALDSDHWWPLEQPEAGAAELKRHWAAVDKN
ncbi:alpha/beta fold hydrolase [Kineosporia succinea]|uniref:Pimeloyl-ACP methyl ester carboxylesterase n=1 Tax=Kineosporia succinea TaxID=84632 RepID=A0ABT9P6V8_9ACTN|nr:alpha/beta fold hydrolase [Kineosporia succinea]MDP9828414.1 pimeloyl-ACP methyl ester carboxylesterase [Kineosporia succinea]